MKKLVMAGLIGTVMMAGSGVFGTGFSMIFAPYKNLAGENGNLKIKIDDGWSIIAVGLSTCIAIDGIIKEGDNDVQHQRSINRGDNKAWVLLQKKEDTAILQAKSTGYWIKITGADFKQQGDDEQDGGNGKKRKKKKKIRNKDKWYLLVSGMHGPKQAIVVVSSNQWPFLGRVKTKGIIWKNVKSPLFAKKRWIAWFDKHQGEVQADAVILEFKKAKDSIKIIAPW